MASVFTGRNSCRIGPERDSFDFVKKIYLSCLAFLLVGACDGKQTGNGGLRDDLARPAKALASGIGVVSLAPNATELLLWLGGGSRLKGVTRYCPVPKKLHVRVVGSMLKPNLERISLLGPGVALLSYEGNSPRLAASLKQLAIPFYVVRIESLSGLFGSIRRMAALLGVRVKKKLQMLRRSVSAVRGKLKERRLFFHIPGGRSVFSFGKRTLLGDLLRLSGAVNCAAHLSGRFPKVAPERLATLNVQDAIVLAAPGSSSAANIRKMWRRISPRTRLHFTGETAYFRPGPQLVRVFTAALDRL